jgi:hypothetical protein
MIILQSFIKFDQGISEKCVGQTFDGRKLLAKQKLMKLDKNNIHINKPKKSESVGQTLPQLPWKQKKGDLKTLKGTTSHGI